MLYFVLSKIAFSYQNRLAVYNLGVFKYFALLPGIFLGLGVLKHFELKKSDKKIYQNFELDLNFEFFVSKCLNIFNIHIQIYIHL